MPRLIFISYRRSDSQHAAHGLYERLKLRFGPSVVFMDVNRRTPGGPWPERIDKALRDTAVMLVVIGPRWLTAADQYGRRRLDLEEDWVRREIKHALDADVPTIPLLVMGVEHMPAREGLPEALFKLSQRDESWLRDVTWDEDLGRLVRTLREQYGFVESEKAVRLPKPRAKALPVSEEELNSALDTLDGWEPVESAVPGEYPKLRQELRKAYYFRSFAKAIGFMSAAAAVADALQHHPRWENQWKTVTVWLSTWDIGHRISGLDFELARSLDAAHEDYKKSNAPPAQPPA